MTPEQRAPRSNSWIVVSKQTGKPVMETFSKKVADSINLANYEVWTAYDWLRRFNARVKLEGVKQS